MKGVLFTISFLLMSGLAMAKFKIPVCVPCEDVEVVKDLPNVDELKDDGLGFIDVGYLYKQYGILYVPIWNTEGQYVLYSGASQTYYELEPEDLEELKAAYDFETPENPLSFWQKFGGKIILLVLVIFFIVGSLGGNDDEEIEEVKTSE